MGGNIPRMSMNIDNHRARRPKRSVLDSLASACPKTTASATLSAAFVTPLCRNWPKFDKVRDKVEDKVSNSRLMGQDLASAAKAQPKLMRKRRGATVPLLCP